MAAKRIGWALVAAVTLIALVASGYGVAPKSVTPAETFTTLGGAQIRLADLRGKVVLINFWATSCGICMAEMPDLAATYRQYRNRGFEVIAVAMHYDDPELVKKYVTKQALPFPVVFDKDGELAREFDQVGATPTTFLIDQAGGRVSKTVGIIHFDKLRAFLESAVPGTS